MMTMKVMITLYSSQGRCLFVVLCSWHEFLKGKMFMYKEITRFKCLHLDTDSPDLGFKPKTSKDFSDVQSPSVT